MILDKITYPIVIKGIAVGVTLCLLYELKEGSLYKEHVHIDYSHLAWVSTTSHAGAITTSASSTASGDFVLA